ncbi:MAG TPA: LysR family transcriptional regulator [Bryobacteraceae bacterium]|nr:LysR family transcriptional regulator [Bryobacteraceae bacterium]
MNISSVNLNLLVAFEALLEERNVSRAAKRAGISQPAMSNALSRLRAMFGDPLFNRVARGVTPTARALELAAPVRAGLAHLRGVFEERPSFEPAASTRSFRLAMTDYSEWRVMPSLLERMGRLSPHSQVLIRRLDRIFIAPEADLRAGTFDAAIGFFPEDSSLDPGTRSCDLFTEENVCILRRGHPLLCKRFTLRQFASASHVAIFYRAESRGLIDNILAGHGLRRRLQAATPHFLTAPFLVAKSDLIAVVPAGLAAHFRKSLSLEVRKVPLLLPPFRMRLLWHEHAEDDPAHKWLRSTLRGEH